MTSRHPTAILLVVVVTLILAALPLALSFSNGVYLAKQQHRSLLLFKSRPRTLLPVARSFSTLDGIDTQSGSSSSNPNDPVYLRWNKEGHTWKMQTAVTTFRRGDTTLDLHAQVHFADADYFDYYNSPAFTKELDHVHYELLVDQDLLHWDSQQQWRLKAPIMASPNDQNLAKSYGWTCQASQIDYTQPKWIHADLTRQEFLKLVQADPSQQQQQQLWKLATPQSSSTAAEAVSALLVGPPQLTYAQSFVKRRLFTNLFLPGSNFANALRALLWMTVPAPELSVILLDWSSLLNSNGGSSSSRLSSRMAGSTNNKNNPSALISDVAWPIFSSLAKLDVASIRRFLFGQVLVSSNTNNRQEEKNQAWSLLVTQRNDHALQILNSTLSMNNDKDVHSALLYGSSHCPDLHAKLIAQGFTPTRTTWRTAWSVQEQQDSVTIVPALVTLPVTYLAVGALDWVGMMGDVASHLLAAGNDANVAESYLDAGVAASLYLVRHVLLYLGFSKFLVDWTNRND